MSSGRKRTTDRHYSAEDQALDQISKEAEERIQARRQARTEAREIRLREIERQQKEEEERQKGQQGTDSKSIASYSGSRRGSNDSTESDVSSKDSRDPKDQLRELEDKYKAAMVTNAQLDNTKTSQVFQLELLKEQLEEQEEGMIEVQREYKDKCRDYDLLKRDFENLKLECDGIKQQIELKDKLLKESGLVIVTTDEGEFSLTKCSNMSDVPIPELGTSIISEEAADLLKKAGEGTLGKSKEKVTSLDSQKEVSISVVDNEVKGDSNSDLAENEDIIKAESKSSEDSDLPAMDSVIAEEKATDNIEIEDENNNDAENNEININSKKDVVQEDKNENARQEGNPELVIGTGKERQSEEDKSGSEDDENEVFFESQSEVCHEERENLSGLNEKREENEIAYLEKQEGVDIKVESKETSEKMTEDKVNEDETESEIAENVSGASNVNIGGVMNVQNKGLESESLVVRPKLGSSSGVRKILYSESVISLESDVTYHSESEDNDLFVEDEKEKLDDSSGDRNLHKIVVDEKVLMRDETDNDSRPNVSFNRGSEGEESSKVAVESNVECRVENDEVSVTRASVENDNGSVLVNDADSDVVPNINETKSLEKENVVVKGDVGSDIPEEVCTSLTHNDEVFMSLPLDKMGYDQDMIQFAKGYVTDIVLKSVDLYNKQIKDEKIMVRQQSYTSKNIDISIPKRHYSEELVDTATNVIPKKLSSGSVEILSPVVHMPSEDKGDLKFFTYKLDTDADVVLTSIEEEQNPLEGMVTMDSLQSPVSGFGVCYSGVEGHSDVDSDDSSNDGAEEIGDETGSPGLVDFISMPVAVDDKVDKETKELGVSEVENKDIVSCNIVDDKEVKNEVDSEISNVPVEKSGKILDTSLENLNTDKAESENACDMQDKDANKVNEELVENATFDGVKEEIDLKGDREKSSIDNEQLEPDNDSEKKDEVGTGSDPNVEEETKAKVGEGKDVEHVEGATGVEFNENSEGNKSENVKSDSLENVTEPGSRLSGEISPNGESGQSVDSGSMNRKKSKKKGSKKNSKEEYDKLRKILADQKSLQEEINRLTDKLDDERSKKDSSAPKSNPSNGPELQLYEVQREASKQIHEYKLKLQKAEQEITNLDGTVNRLETQVKRFKYDAEEAEKLEEELKSDRRRLQRELRECQNQIEELQNQNKHLTKRLEKIRQTRSALGVNT
ncbi:putative leucine-rich repeat-containing protein DDB_G0290503 [Mercenaria mercenaria]|uniref:putative leucine-rich repeat-containing protein DDB_G0290503 n=1 Tax=Mercenaria mercenaria TaxID=6596 RepID=UPI00234EB2FD|nr:putative leucine-rich repeat-containing protein DDB_G0290503 [Mercenaria mercenaria]